MSYQPLTDLQWQLLEPLFPSPAKRGRGKPHTSWRCVLNSIFWVLRTGGKWGALPKDPSVYASKSAAHRWYIEWEKTGKLQEILKTYESFSEMSQMISPNRRVRKSYSELSVTPSESL